MRSLSVYVPASPGSCPSEAISPHLFRTSWGAPLFVTCANPAIRDITLDRIDELYREAERLDRDAGGGAAAPGRPGRP